MEESAGKDSSSSSSSSGSKSYTVKGMISRQEGEGGSCDLNSNGTVTLHVTELPVRKWTQDYKEFLETMMAGSSSEAKDKSVAGLVKVREGVRKEEHGVCDWEFESNCLTVCVWICGSTKEMVFVALHEIWVLVFESMFSQYTRVTAVIHASVTHLFKPGAVSICHAIHPAFFPLPTSYPPAPLSPPAIPPITTGHARAPHGHVGAL